jgi:anti-sigma factor RsiW
MTEQHVDIEELAAYAGGDLDATAAVAVEAHVLLCPQCRADVAGLAATAAALAAVAPVVMPPEAVAALDAVLAAEAVAPARRTDTVLPMRRRRPSLAGLAAVAAGIALVAAISVPFLRHDTPTSAKTAAPAAAGARDATTVTTKRLASGLNYTRPALAATLLNALGGATTAREATGSSALPPAAAAPGFVAPTSTKARADTTSLTALEADNGRLAACVAELAKGVSSPAAAVPLLVDFASFAGKPAIVVAFPYVSVNGTVSNKIDVFVAGPACGVAAGGDVLDFQRIDRPRGL